jgi:hypothetical protein
LTDARGAEDPLAARDLGDARAAADARGMDPHAARWFER